MRIWRSATVALAAVLLTLTACSSPPEAVAPKAGSPAPEVPADLAPFYNQSLDWRNCGTADCAKLTVPLDYADPSGPTIELAIIRVAAGGGASGEASGGSTSAAIGSLFVNPGGPGGSAVDYARAAPYIFGDVILDSFNVVGLDPRGVGLSEPIQCFTDEKIDEFNSEPFANVKTLSNTDLELEYAELGNLCESNNGELLNHMSTIESAQDLDIARAAVGDDVLNYLGKSYGTAIGAAYIRLFPNTIGRVVLDGVLPIDIDAAEVTQTQAEAFEVATAHFIADCVARDDCPFSPGPDVAVQELRDLFTSLDRVPVITTDPNRPLNGALLSRAVLSYLYFPEMDYPRLRAALAEVVNNEDGTAALALADERTNRGPEGEYLNNSTDAYFGVTCLDLPYQGSVQDARAFSAELAVIAPTFGEQLGLGVLACRNWPAVGPSLPPLPQSINAPILIANPANDPATPLVWAQRLNEQLPDSRLVVWNTHHHTAYTNGSRCVDEIVETYLLTGDAPTFTECSA